MITEEKTNQEFMSAESVKDTKVNKIFQTKLLYVLYTKCFSSKECWNAETWHTLQFFSIALVLPVIENYFLVTSLPHVANIAD